jgi:hypothetical protein
MILSQEKPPETPVALVLRASYDHNGALAPELPNNRYLLETLAKTHRLVIKTLEDNQVGKAIRETPGSIEILAIEAHGYPSFIAFSEDSAYTTPTAEDFASLAPSSIIILNSCSTGAPGGIAEKIARAAPSHLVYAPVQDALTSRVFLSRIDGNLKLIQYNQDFLPITRLFSFQQDQLLIQDVAEEARWAFHWYLKRALAGEPDCMYELAMCYSQGFGTSYAPEEALLWLEKAAALDHPSSLVLLGVYFLCYDPPSALSYFHRSAHLGSSLGQFFLGLHYESIDPSEAIHWYHQAANALQPEALSALGRCYESGIGHPQDLYLAIECYKIASLLGEEEAKIRLEYLAPDLLQPLDNSPLQTP